MFFSRGTGYYDLRDLDLPFIVDSESAVAIVRDHLTYVNIVRTDDFFFVDRKGAINPKFQTPSTTFFLTAHLSCDVEHAAILCYSEEPPRVVMIDNKPVSFNFKLYDGDRSQFYHENYRKKIFELTPVRGRKLWRVFVDRIRKFNPIERDIGYCKKLFRENLRLAKRKEKL